IRTYLFANAVEIETSPNGQVVTGLQIATLRGNQFRLTARMTVLAVGGIEVPRLLLLSNRVLNCGLGNEHDLVGRFYNDHPRMTAGVLELADAPRYRPLYSMHAVRHGERSTTVEGFLATGDRSSAQERILRCAFHLPARWRSFPTFNSRGVDSVRQ